MTIKVYFSDQAGAPLLNGTVGSLISVLDAVLVNGYNQVNVSSLTRVGSVVTVTCATPHGYENPIVRPHNKNGVGNVCTIAGAVEAAYNGDWPVTYVSDLVFTFDIGAAVPATPASGTITTKRAPAGFSKPFADPNRGVYRSDDLSSRRHFLQVNDIADCPNSQGARFAGWRGFENMLGIDQWENPFPTVVAAPWGQYIAKSDALDSSSRGWAVISDGKFFFLWLSPATSATNFAANANQRLFGFGDFRTAVPDAYATLISAGTSGETTIGTSTNSGLMFPSANTWGTAIPGSGWTCVARRFNGLAQPVWAAGLTTGLCTTGQECFGYRAVLPHPNPIDNRYYLQQIKVTDGGHIRGVLGYYEGPSGVVHSPRELIGNVVGLEGRTLLYLRGAPVNNSYTGGVYIDVTGDSNGKWS